MDNPTTPQEFEEWLNKQAELFEEGVISQEEYDNAVKDAKAQMIGYAASMKGAKDQLKKSFYELGGSIIKGEEGAAVYNKSLTAGANVLSTLVSKIPYVGKLISMVVDAGAKYATAVNEQADSLFKNYKELSRNGLALGMEDTFKNLQDMGYTAAEVGNMTALVKENAATLATFGGTAAEGTKKFAAAAKEIQYSSIGTQFKLMGMTADGINAGMARYAKYQQMSGTLTQQTDKEFAESAKDYILEQDKLTKMTGLSADQQQEALNQAYANERFQATQLELKAKGDAESMALYKRNEEVYQALVGRGAKETAAAWANSVSGFANSPDVVKMQITHGEVMNMLSNRVTDTGTVLQAFGRGAKRYTETMSTQAQFGAANQIGLNYSEQANLQSMEADERSKNLEKNAKAEQEAQRKGADAQTANMVKITQDQRNQTMVTDKLTNAGITPVTTGMAALAEGLENATDIVGQLAGRTQRVGGGETAVHKGYNAASSAISGAMSAAPAQLQRIISAESGGRNIANQSGEGGKPTSSATGVAQMTKSTFEGLVKNAKQGSALYGKTFEDMRGSVDLQVAAAQELLNKNSETLTKAGFAANDANVYLAHFLGSAGAKKVLAAPDTTPIENVVGADQIKANKSVFANARTVGELKAWADKKMAAQDAALAAVENPKQKQKQAKMGGIISGPDAGFQATLHGTEAVVPLPGGRAIPVEFNNIAGPKSKYQSMVSNDVDMPAKKNKESKSVAMPAKRSSEQLQLLAVELDKIESLVRIMAKQNDISSKILQRQS